MTTIFNNYNGYTYQGLTAVNGGITVPALTKYAVFILDTSSPIPVFTVQELGPGFHVVAAGYALIFQATEINAL